MDQESAVSVTFIFAVNPDFTAGLEAAQNEFDLDYQRFVTSAI